MQILDGRFSQHIHAPLKHDLHLTILMVSFKKQLFILVVMAETLALTNKTNLKFWHKRVFFLFDLVFCNNMSPQSIQQNKNAS